MSQTRYKKSAETQTRILDAAEELFAKQGYEATTTRQITTAAGVRNASVNYYFATKQELAVAVVDRRFDVLRRAREARINAVDLERGHARRRLRAIVEAFVLPLAELTRSGGPGWIHYNRIMAQIAASGEWTHAPYAERVDESAYKFIDAFMQVFPDASRAEAIEAFELMLGAVLLAFTQSARFERGQGKRARTSHDPQRLVEFLVAGLFQVLSR